VIEALLHGVGDALVFGVYFALSVIGTVVLVAGLLVAILYWLELKER
jgi:hypothetical protein